jgi:hypothetical protein
MSAEKSPDWLIDLLYADEEHEFDSEGPPDEAGLDEAESLELEGLRDLLGQVRASRVDVAPPEGLSASILAAAREVSAEASAEAARPEARRAAPGRPAASPGEGSLWGRARANTFAQIGAVAAVLLVGAFMVNRIHGTSSEAEMGAGMEVAAKADDLVREQPAAAAVAGADAPAADGLALKEEAAGAAESGDQAQAAVEAIEGNLDRARNEDPAELDELAVGKALDEARERARREEAGLLSTKRSRDYEALSDKKTAAKADPAPPKKDSYIALSEKDLDGIVSGELENTPGDAPNEPVALNAPSAPSRSSSSGFGTEARYESTPSAARPPSPEPAEESEAKPTKLADEVVESAMAQRNAARTSSAQAADDIAARENQDATDKQPAPSLGEVERMARAERHRDTIAAADRYLKSGMGANADRARALELKAEALAAQGKGDEAQRVYDEIEKKYPTHFKRPAQKRQKRKAVRKKAKSLDVDFDEAVEAF